MDARAFAPAVRVFVVDDSPLFRSAARELIDDTAGFVWIGEASNGEDGVEETLRLQPDLVLMDVRMPGIGGIEAASRIASHPSPPIVLLITGADLPDRVPDGTAGEILPRITSTTLRSGKRGQTATQHEQCEQSTEAAALARIVR